MPEFSTELFKAPPQNYVPKNKATQLKRAADEWGRIRPY